jgi:hypothetical protein
MADTKISAFTPVVTLGPTDIFPIVQGGVNKFATIGQISNLAVAGTQVVTTSAGIPVAVSSDVVLVSSAATLGSGTVSGKKLTIVATGPGSIAFTASSVPVLYTYAAGSTMSLVWANSTWNILSIFNMTRV